MWAWVPLEAQRTCYLPQRRIVESQAQEHNVRRAPFLCGSEGLLNGISYSWRARCIGSEEYGPRWTNIAWHQARIFHHSASLKLVGEDTQMMPTPRGTPAE